MVLQAPVDLRGWIDHFRDAPIPVLQQSAAALDALRANDDADVRAIAAIAADDPLLTLRVLAMVSRNRPQRLMTDVETVDAAILLLGIPPLLRQLADLPTVESRLAAFPDALQGLQRVLCRAQRAAVFALSIAVSRKDNEAAIVHEAAMLHDFAEALLWCHAPQLALRIDAMQRDDPTLRSAAAQRAVLHIELPDLEQALMRCWRLPELLVKITDHRQEREPRVRNVLLAVRLARHSQRSWDNPALPDDLREIGELVSQTPLAVRRRLMALA
ncbi:MAG TPA: HDOD domain-containing protein [Burkholderiaceae bacterium]|nr:HDOD domain-containing protein [Burkholderiaceae bacterium]